MVGALIVNSQTSEQSWEDLCFKIDLEKLLLESIDAGEFLAIKLKINKHIPEGTILLLDNQNTIKGAITNIGNA